MIYIFYQLPGVTSYIVLWNQSCFFLSAGYFFKLYSVAILHVSVLHLSRERRRSLSSKYVNNCFYGHAIYDCHLKEFSLLHFLEMFFEFITYFALLKICFEKSRHDQQMAELDVNFGCYSYLTIECRVIWMIPLGTCILYDKC